MRAPLPAFAAICHCSGLSAILTHSSSRAEPERRRQLFEDGELAPFVNVYLGGEDVRTLDGLETRVNGASVILLPAMAGGC